MFSLKKKSFLFQLIKATTEKKLKFLFFSCKSINLNLMQSFLLLQLQIHEKKLFNPLHPDVSMHILHTVSYSFGKELKRGIC